MKCSNSRSVSAINEHTGQRDIERTAKSQVRAIKTVPEFTECSMKTYAQGGAVLELHAFLTLMRSASRPSSFVPTERVPGSN
jgi:hypothetical protein